MPERVLKPGWKVWRFDQIAVNVADRVEPGNVDVDYYLGLEHLDSDSLKIRRWGKPSDVEATKLLFRKGDIIFGRRRVYQRKLAVAEFDGICSAHAMVLRPKTEVVLPEFLPFFMQSDLFMTRALEISVGSLSPTINWRTLAQQEFALPPLAEQQRIVEMLAASEIAIHGALEALHAAEALLRAAVENVAEIAAKQGVTVSVAQLVKKSKPITYGILKPGTGYPGGIPVIKVKDYPNGEVDESGLLLTSPDIDAEYARSRLEAGDLLISIRGTIGRLAFVLPSLHGANITQDTARLSLLKSVNHDYTRFMLESAHVQRQIISRSTGMAVRGINLGELRKVKVPMVDRQRQDNESEQLSKIRQAILTTQKRYSNSQVIHRALLGRILETG